MRTLILMRHAHAEAGEEDFSRALSERGEQEARGAGRQLCAAGVQIQRLLCSSAPRAQRTAELVARELGFTGVIEARDDLYEGGVGRYQDAVAETGAEVGTVLLVAHNPTISTLASLLQGTNTAFPPAGFAIQRGETRSWHELVG